MRSRGAEISAWPASSLSSIPKEIKDLFRISYRNANECYLEKSFNAFSHLAVAKAQGEIVAFALGDTQLREVPRVGVCPVSLAGIACVAPSWRRRGLFTQVATAALTAGVAIETRGVHLVAGRVAHPASYRSFGLPNAVPRPGISLTSWHREVGAFVAGVYGAKDFDEDHFVCVGNNEGPGEPDLKLETPTAAEEELFQFVDRARGDSLLVTGWFPSAPAGWLSTEQHSA